MYHFFSLHFLQSTAQQIAVSTDAFVQRTVDILQHRVMTAIESAGIQPDTIPNLVEQFSNFELPFNGIQTLHERNKFIIQNYFYVVRIFACKMICFS